MRPKTKTWLAFSLAIFLASCQAPSLDISKVKAVSKLASLEVKLDKMLFARHDKQFLPILFGGFNISKPSFISFTEATILIGVDMEKLKEQDLDISPGEIKITLPPVELLDFSYPASKFREDSIYVIANNKWSIDQKELVYQMGELEIREMLPYLGMEEKAQQKIITLLTPILSGMGFEKIEIDFRKAKDSDFMKREDSIEALKKVVTG